jgi:hypothetical protein
MIGRCGDYREVIVMIRRCGDDQEVWCRGGEWVSAARREHSREVVRQRMLHAIGMMWDATARLENP